MKEERVLWLDVLKALGIFAIYLGHFVEAGNLYKFVFIWHVPLFFFASGCAENFSTEKSLCSYIMKKFRSLIIPYFFFAFLSLAIFVVNYTLPTDSPEASLLLIAQGAIRNRFFVNSLWFFTCLFVMSIVFWLIKCLQIKPLILLACLALFFASETLLPSRPIVNPQCPWNIDSAMYYILYYGIGYVTFPIIIKLFRSSQKFSSFMGLAFSGVMAMIFTILVYYNHNPFLYLNAIPGLSVLVPVITACVILWLLILISYSLCDVPFFVRIGQNTLHLCGAEFFVKMIISSILQIIGLSLTLPTPFAVLLYTTFLLWFAMCTFVPFSQYVLQKKRRIGQGY